MPQIEKAGEFNRLVADFLSASKGTNQ